MKKRNEFYIGYQDKMPPNTKSFLKGAILFTGLLLVIVAIVLAFIQQPFRNHVFELGNVKEISGTYFSKPVPILIAHPGVLPEDLSPEVLLVGYGKFGAEGIIKKIEEKNSSLDGKSITLRGTLIYGDGKTVMELTKKENSLVAIDGQTQNPNPATAPANPVSLKGEILDPKCYFGVMKPGEGKIHKSCAIRCISGGIPPVFRHETNNENSPYKYYIMLGRNGEKINKELLPYVAEKIQIKGLANNVNGWDVLYSDANQIKAVH